MENQFTGNLPKIIFNIGKPTETTFRIYLLDPGLVISQIEVQVI